MSTTPGPLPPAGPGAGRVRAWIVAGPAGSGKSTLGCALARRVGAAVLDQDTLTNPLVAVVARLVGAPSDDPDAPAVRQATRDPRYDALLGVTADNVDIGTSVVVVAPFTAECADPRRWAAVVRRLEPAEVTLVWVDCPPELLWERLSARGATRDAGKLADRAAFLDRPLAAPAVPHVPVDGAAPTEEQVAAALRLGR